MYNYIDLQDTIVAIATPPGMGAIAVIRLSGDKAIDIVQKVWKGKNLHKASSHSIHLGYIRDEKGKNIDQVLVSLFKTPKSYTKEDVIEISCHGSTFIQQQLLALFLRNGARMAKEGEFTMRAFLNGQLDLSQAEAVGDLIHAESEAQHRVALQQMRGGFSDEIKNLRKELIDFTALIELELDFSEEDVEFADRSELQALVERIKSLIYQLIQSFQLGNAIKNGIPTVIAGRPNAGKSTLLNALLNEERAIVSAIAGTTRDVIEEALNIHGAIFRITDTAGIREATDTVEAIGVERALERIGQAALLVYVFDATELSIEEVEKDIKQLQRADMHHIVIANKMDAYDGKPMPSDYLTISAKEKSNIDLVKNRLYALGVGKAQAQGDIVVTNVRHCEALQEAYDALERVLEGMEFGISGELLAMDIHESLRHLGEITGDIDVDRDILGTIFGKFCIGK